MDKKIIILSMIVGSTIGGAIPTLFGSSAFSFSSIILGAVGGVIGIWLAFKFLS